MGFARIITAVDTTDYTHCGLNSHCARLKIAWVVEFLEAMEEKHKEAQK